MSTNLPTKDCTCKKQWRIFVFPKMHELSVNFWVEFKNFCLLTTLFHVWNDLVFLKRWKKGIVHSFSKFRYSATHWSKVKNLTSPNRNEVTPVILGKKVQLNIKSCQKIMSYHETRTSTYWKPVLPPSFIKLYSLIDRFDTGASHFESVFFLFLILIEFMFFNLQK